MRRFALHAAAVALVLLGSAGTTQARGFGGFRAGGFHYSYGAASIGGYHYAGYSGYHYGTAARTAGYHYDDLSRERIDPLHPASLDYGRGVAATGWRGAYDRTRFPTDMGLSRYSDFGVRGFHVSYWSRGYMDTRAGYVRASFGYYHCFRPAWFAIHPNCWSVARWREWDYWRWMNWGGLYVWCGLDSYPIYYNYGDNVICSAGDVYQDGSDLGSTQEYAQQANDIAAQGQAANPPPDDEWKALGVFALVQGEEKTSNNVFQLAVNKNGVIRGNYYDGLMDTTTEVYGQVDKKTKRAAWTIGKKKDRVFEAGAANLTRSETPILVHAASGLTQQFMLVRINPPKDATGSN